jgi:hypothetical protein
MTLIFFRAINLANLANLIKITVQTFHTAKERRKNELALVNYN